MVRRRRARRGRGEATLNLHAGIGVDGAAAKRAYSLCAIPPARIPDIRHDGLNERHTEWHTVV